MSSRSLNKVQLIGNLTRDPELRYTPTGAAVCTIGLATNRMWTTESGEKKEETEFHRVVAWNKLAELCSQLLTKGRKIYVEGRLRTNAWQGTDGAQRTTTEVVIEDMIILDSRRPVTSGEEAGEAGEVARATAVAQPVTKPVAAAPVMKKKTEEVAAVKTKEVSEDINPDDIPF
jgi:single-strand DNA-binding protein